ncbi:hypothetical protein [Sphingobium sp. AP50]|uniref:hypothetical protein n=1 Tax=Sphingobium sp. AP50 TaxID=1884369 RepID=UPI000B831BF1|nr:hypothetical protein [Sphingobium sp. AP50]
MIALMGQALVAYGIWTALGGLYSLVDHWQTLITGFMALGAAYLTYRPVREQLKLTQTQSNAVMRDMLLNRQKELQQAQEAIEEKVYNAVTKLSFALDIFSTDKKLDNDDAFEFSQSLTRAMAWLRVRYVWRNSVSVEMARTKVDESLEKLVSLLDEIWGPHADQQNDDIHRYTKAEWAKVLRRSDEAKEEIQNANFDVINALNAMMMEISREIRAIDSKLSKLDDVLLSA